MSGNTQEPKAQITPENTPAIVTPAIKLVMDFSAYSEKFSTPAGYMSTLLKPDVTASALAKKEVAIIGFRKWVADSKNYANCDGHPGAQYDLTISKIASPYTTKLLASMKVSEFPDFIVVCENTVKAHRANEIFLHPRNGEVNPSNNPAEEKVVDLTGLVAK